MKNYLLSVLAIMVFALPSIGQINFFNRNYRQGDSIDNERAQTFIETNRGYLVTDYSYSNAYPPENDKIRIFEVDKNGEMLWNIEYTSDTIFLSPSGSRIFQGNDSTYDWFLNVYDSSSYIYRPALLRFDRQGNLYFTKVIDGPEMTDTLGYIPGPAVRTNDGGYLLACNTGGWIVTLLKLSKSLDIEWKKELGYAHTYTGIRNIFQLSDGSFMIGSTFGFGNNDGDGRVIHLSKSGEIVWITPTGGPLQDIDCNVIQNPDSSFLAITSYTTEATWWGDATKGRFEITKIDKSGHKTWTKLIGNEMYLPLISSSFLLPDSSVVFTGSNGYMQIGYMFRISQEGDSLLYREFVPATANTYLYWFQDGLPTSDHGILFCGSVMMMEPQNQYPEIPWLVKTDWYGCSFLGCDSSNLYILGNTTSHSVCKGESSWFTVKAYGSGLEYQWQEKESDEWINLQDDGICAGTRTDSLQIVNTSSFTAERIYRCRVSNSKWRLFTPEIYLYYYEPPAIVTQPVSASVKEGAGIWFQFIASGSENPSYQWYFMGNPVSGANSCRFVIPSVTLSDSGYYQCIAWNGCGQVYSDTAWLTTHADGITNPSGKQAMLLYPDPVINEISVYTGIPRDKKYRISIYNSLGELKAEKEGKSGNGILRFTTEDLASGFYLLDLNINGLHQRLKFLRQ